jgi:hypothetical protein
VPDCSCLPYPYGDGPEEDCPVHGRHSEPNDGPGPDGHHTVTGECFACLVGVSTGPESHGDRCSYRRGGGRG